MVPWFSSLSLFRCRGGELRPRVRADNALRSCAFRAMNEASGMASESLLADAEPGDNALVTFKILALQVVEQAAAFADHLDETEA